MKIKGTIAGLLLFASAGAIAQAPVPADEIEFARNAIQAGDLETAISRLENMDIGVDNWEQHFWLGTAFLLDGQLDHAADALDRALGIEGGMASIWVQRAVVEQERGRLTVALQFLEIAAAVDSEYPMTYLNAGQVYERLGKWSEARSAYGQFLKLSMRNQSSARMLRLRREVLQRVAASDAVATAST